MRSSCGCSAALSIDVGDTVNPCSMYSRLTVCSGVDADGELLSSAAKAALGCTGVSVLGTELAAAVFDLVTLVGVASGVASVSGDRAPKMLLLVGPMIGSVSVSLSDSTSTRNLDFLAVIFPPGLCRLAGADRRRLLRTSAASARVASSRAFEILCRSATMFFMSTVSSRPIGSWLFEAGML